MNSSCFFLRSAMRKYLLKNSFLKSAHVSVSCHSSLECPSTTVLHHFQTDMLMVLLDLHLPECKEYLEPSPPSLSISMSAEVHFPFKWWWVIPHELQEVLQILFCCVHLMRLGYLLTLLWHSFWTRYRTHKLLSSPESFMYRNLRNLCHHPHHLVHVNTLDRLSRRS